MKRTKNQLKVWLEINQSAAKHNFQVLKNQVNKKTQIYSVIKSNAYGHGIFAFAEILKDLANGFCVDSVIEALALRQQGINKPILVLGPTLSELFYQAFENNITLSISSFDALHALVKKIPNPKNRPQIHLKIDSGMHRQGFYPKELSKVFQFIKSHKINLTGLFSHLASAKDINYPTYSELQYTSFQNAATMAKKVGFSNLQFHLSATAGTLLNKKYHFDLIRTGIGLYGIYPSKEIEIQLSSKFKLQPVLSFHSIVSEIKKINKNEYIGYDLTEKVSRDSTIAIIPIGYWHGLPWALSSKGHMLIQGKRAKILGRISMDLTAVDITDIKNAKTGDLVTIIGTQANEEITAREIAEKINSTPYEIITRLNPLIEKIIT
jgi:alanine racemase